MNVEEFIYSPLPAAILGNVFYPYRHLKTNIMLGKELAPLTCVGAYWKVPSFWDHCVYITKSRPFYSLWDGYTPTVLSDVAYLFTYSMSAMYLFKRKRRKSEHFFKSMESNRLAMEECVLSVLSNTVTMPLRSIALRAMAQLTANSSFDYRWVNY